MSRACEQFIDGSGDLAALLRSIPPFLPPQRLQDAVIGLARAESARRELAGMPLVQGFDPPSYLDASFRTSVALVDFAQAVRREAVLTQIVRGKSVQAALEANVTTATAKWVESQTNGRNDRSAGMPATQMVSVKRLRLWKGLSFVATAGMVAMMVPRLFIENQAPLDVGIPVASAPSPTAEPTSDRVDAVIAPRGKSETAQSEQPINSESTRGRLGSVIAPTIRSENTREVVAKGTESAKQNDQIAALNNESHQRSRATTPAGDAQSRPEKYLMSPSHASTEGHTSSSRTVMSTPGADMKKQQEPLIVRTPAQAFATPVAKANIRIRATLNDDPERIAQHLVSRSPKARWILYSGIADLSAVRTWANRLSHRWQTADPIQILRDSTLPTDSVEFRLAEPE